jgi:hypothetical protein
LPLFLLPWLPRVLPTPSVGRPLFRPSSRMQALQTDWLDRKLQRWQLQGSKVRSGSMSAVKRLRFVQEHDKVLCMCCSSSAAAA